MLFKKLADIYNSQTAKAYLFTFLMALLYGACFTITDFYDLDFNSLSSFCILALQLGVVVLATFCLMLIITSNRYVFATLFPLLTTLSAIMAYYRATAKVQVTAETLELALVNDVRTCMEVVAPLLVVITIAALAASIVLAWFRFKKIRFGKPHYIIAPMIGVILLAGLFSTPRLGLPISNRIPFSLFKAIWDQSNSRKNLAKERPEFDGQVACEADSMTVIMIIGETARAKNLSINGYERETTPLLQQERNVASLPFVHTQFGCTHLCVPYMLTRADSARIDLMYQERSFIDIFKRGGYATTWVANQEKVGTYEYFMAEADTTIWINGGKSVYVTTEWLDDDILPHIENVLTQSAGDYNRKLIVLHTIGSHWYYNGHFTKEYERWKPTTDSKVTCSNTREQMINSYDNTILFSDHFWHEVINRVRQRNAIIFYLSDHGENLGEDGRWLHASDHPALRNPACWIWYSDLWAERYPDKVQKLLDRKNEPHDAAFLFHSIIDAGDIQADCVEEEYDIFR